MNRDSGRHPQGENSRSEVEGEACQSGGVAASPNIDSTTPTTGEDDVEPSPIDDSETRAFISGWNARARNELDFDRALHFWTRERCGIYGAMDIGVAALAAISPTTEDAEKRELVEALWEVRKICEQGALPSSTQVARIWARLNLVKGFALASIGERS